MEQLNRFYDVWHECDYAYEVWAKEHGISVNALFVLSAIYECAEDCTQKNISQRWLIPKQTVNMILKDFITKGLVELVPMHEDKRNKLIRFTESGKEYADGILSELRETELFVIDEMGIERMKLLNDNAALFAELFNKNRRHKQ
ncbi:MAG: MarR family transcriptional regulator [Firmicutes bacterium]|nr:MarR family transcriptional regulator [Bacillota bacterium]